ncbi:MAG TPA: hypothetical protein VLL98_04100 [Rickettsiales bacterium]|nr:hypothetical protein [Rickettsiales bacterium]
MKLQEYSLKPKIVTRYTNSKHKIDEEKEQLFPEAFYRDEKDEKEISVFNIDDELKQKNADFLIFELGDKRVYKKSKTKTIARGDLKTINIENIKFDDSCSLYLEYTDNEKHCNIKPSIDDWFFDLKKANKLASISVLKKRY